jgi:hypothetical protein
VTFFDYLASERHKLLSSALAAFIGFFIALLANSYVDDWKERLSLAARLTAVQAEANSNDIVLHQSFLPLYESGIVLREFGTAVVTQALADPVFVKHATAAEIATLAAYFRNVSLANTYRAKVETIRFNNDYFKESDDESIKRWESGLVQAWGTNLRECADSLDAVKALP